MLRIRLFGPMELSDEDQLLPLPATRKAQALLGYLALRRKSPQPRDRLAELFWGERSEEKARSSLSTGIWQIRHCLPVSFPFLISDTWMVQFNPLAEVMIDVEQFESLASGQDIASLQNALTLYRGDFLPGSYEDWIIHERYRLENTYLDVLQRLMDGYASRGDFAASLEVARRLLAQDPLREDANRAVMRSLYLLDQRSAALEQFQHCRAVLWAELGVEPALETSQLYRDILQENIVVSKFDRPEFAQTQARSSELVLLPGGRDPLSPGFKPPLSGREAALSALEAAWQQANASRGGMLLVTGEAGVGKTRLVEEFSERLRWKGTPVLWGHCYEFERILPYQPVGEMLRSVRHDLALFVANREQGGLPSLRAEIARLVPELGEAQGRSGILPADPAIQSGPVEPAQHLLFEGVAQFLGELSRSQALLLVVEDLHWTAESTLELLHFLLRRLASQPILVLGTYRPEELGRSHPLSLFREHLEREHLLTNPGELHLSRLSAQEVEALLRELSGQGEAILPLARRLFQENAGNPFFLIEVIKALFETQVFTIEQGAWQGNFNQISSSKLPLPDSMAEAIRNRVRRLQTEAQQALTWAAIIGREFDFTLLRKAWDQGEEQTLQALDALLRRGLVEEGQRAASRDYAFSHHKIQEVIYSDLSRQRRGRGHARVGRLIEQTNMGSLEEHFGELAHHFVQAQEVDGECTEKAIYYLLKAGDQARVVYANNEASLHYEQARQLLQAQGDAERLARLSMKLGVNYHNAYQFDQAHQAFEAGFRYWQAASRAYRFPDAPASHALRMNWPPITSIDPALAMDMPGVVAWQLFRCLVALNPEMEIVPEAARAWEVLPGGRGYIFHLREDMLWSDDRPVSAADYVYSCQRHLAPVTGSPFASLFFDIQGARDYHLGKAFHPDQVGIRAVDPLTLVIELEKPAPYFLQLLSSFLPVPPQAVAAFPADWTEPEHLVTNGPFRVQQWRKGEMMTLARDPAYCGSYSGNLMQVDLFLEPDPVVHLGRYANNELDVLDLRMFPTEQLDRIQRDYAGDYFSFPWALVHYLGFDTRRAPFSDPRVRRAFALAIDRQALAVALRNTVFPASGGFTPPGLPGHTPGIALPYDPAQARALLTQAGYAHNFPPIEALTPHGSDDLINSFLVSQWRDNTGIEVRWQTVDKELYQVLEKSPPHIFLSHWLADYPDPDNFVGASQMRRWTGWQAAAFLRLLEETRQLTDQAHRLRLYSQADKMLIESAAILPLIYDRQRLLIKPWVRRYPTSALFAWFWKDVVIEAHP